MEGRDGLLGLYSYGKKLARKTGTFLIAFV